jgi:predicted nucleic acid-binding protein
MPFVLDASVALAWALAEDESNTAQAALARLRTDDAVAPAPGWFEVRNTLADDERRGRLTEADKAALLGEIARLGIAIDPAPQELEVLALARRHRLTVYDAAYLELAQRLGVPLATLGRALQAAARRSGSHCSDAAVRDDQLIQDPVEQSRPADARRSGPHRLERHDVISITRMPARPPLHPRDHRRVLCLGDRCVLPCRAVCSRAWSVLAAAATAVFSASRRISTIGSLPDASEGPTSSRASAADPTCRLRRQATPGLLAALATTTIPRSAEGSLRQRSRRRSMAASNEWPSRVGGPRGAGHRGPPMPVRGTA